MTKSLRVVYPGFVNKALTFSIDDGNLRWDGKMLDILRPAGIKGTFNLCAPKDGVTREEYLDLYRGYEISNHTLKHPYAFRDGVEYKLSGDDYVAGEADPEFIYRHAEDPSLYWFLASPGRWRLITDADSYNRGIDLCREKLEEIFGEGSVRGFVWPFREMRSEKIKEHIKLRGYYGARRSSTIGSTTGFSLPEDTMAWSCNARHDTLLELMREYMDYPDDGELKFFAFGVHSADFEHDSRWDDLECFAREYGGRENELWYATVGEIFDYASAARRLCREGDVLTNPTDTPLYLIIEDKRVVLNANESISLS